MAIPVEPKPPVFKGLLHTTNHKSAAKSRFSDEATQLRKRPFSPRCSPI